MSHAQLPLILKIGCKAIPVRDLSDASFAYQDERDMSGKGASEFPSGKVSLAGNEYRVSYNGRVWLGNLMVLETQ